MREPLKDKFMEGIYLTYEEHIQVGCDGHWMVHYDTYKDHRFHCDKCGAVTDAIK